MHMELYDLDIYDSEFSFKRKTEFHEWVVDLDKGFEVGNTFTLNPRQYKVDDHDYVITTYNAALGGRL